MSKQDEKADLTLEYFINRNQQYFAKNPPVMKPFDTLKFDLELLKRDKNVEDIDSNEND